MKTISRRPCILLGISPNILRGRLRFRLWELRAGQKVSVVGCVMQGQPFIVSPLLGQAVDANISTQSKKSLDLDIDASHSRSDHAAVRPYRRADHAGAYVGGKIGCRPGCFYPCQRKVNPGL